MNWPRQKPVVIVLLILLSQICASGQSTNRALSASEINPSCGDAFAPNVVDHAEAVAVNHHLSRKTQEEDLQYLNRVYDQSVEQLAQQSDLTRNTIADSLASTGLDGISIENVLTGAGPAGTQYSLTLSSSQRSQTLIINAGHPQALSSVFGGKPSKGQMTISGGEECTGKMQDAHLFGSYSRVSSNMLCGSALGPKHRGHNEIVGTAQSLHLAGLMDMPAIFGARVIRAQYANRGKKSNWSHDTSMRLLVSSEIPKHVAMNSELMQAFRKRKHIQTDPVTKRERFVFWVYTNAHVIASGVTSPNIFLGPKSKEFLSVYQSLQKAVQERNHLAQRPTVGFTNLYIKLSWDGAPIAKGTSKVDISKELPPNYQKATVFDAGPGDSGYINVQKTRILIEQAIQPLLNASIKTGSEREAYKLKLIRERMPNYLMVGRDAHMQPIDTRSLFNRSGPYWDAVRFSRSEEISDVEFVDRNGNPVKVEFSKNGEPKPYEEIAKELENLQIRITLSSNKSINSLEELAQFFRLEGDGGAEQFLLQRYLPNSYYKDEYLHNGEVNIDKVRNDLKRGANPESILKKNALAELLKKKFSSDASPVRTITADYLDISQGYNNKPLLDSVVRHYSARSGSDPIELVDKETNGTANQGERDVLLSDLSVNEIPSLMNGIVPPQLVGRRLPDNDVFLIGAAIGPIGRENLTDGSSTAEVGKEILKTFAESGGNVSGIGLQSQGPASRLAGPLIHSKLGRTGNSPKKSKRSLRDALVDKTKKMHPTRRTVLRPQGDFDTATIDTGRKIVDFIPIEKDRAALENTLFHKVFKSYWLSSGKANQTVLVQFERKPSGKLVIYSRGAETGLREKTNSLAQSIGDQLVANPALLDRLSGALQQIGDIGKIELKWEKDGLLRADSVRLYAPVKQVAEQARRLLDTNGKNSLERNRDRLLSSLPTFRAELLLETATGKLAQPSSRQTKDSIIRLAQSAGLNGHLEIGSIVRLPNERGWEYELVESGEHRGSLILSTTNSQVINSFAELAGNVRSLDEQSVTFGAIQPAHDLQKNPMTFLVRRK